MFHLSSKKNSCIAKSKLYDQSTFYNAFLTDLSRSRNEVIIESPFLTVRRTRMFLPILLRLCCSGVKVIVNTKDTNELDQAHMRKDAEESIDILQSTGVAILFTGGHHRKTAIIDRNITWEGSLNILSQNDSCEIMRRTASSQIAEELLQFIQLERFI
jgi:phosphatidylserine/phosphatidylglycerophosphate/cardiolipin synthase-like enzyme